MFKQPLLGPYRQAWQWPTGVSKTDWERVDFWSPSGAQLHGLLGRTHAAETRGAVVLCHPLRRDAKGFYLKNGHADWLRAHGYDVLLFDFNGLGESTNGDFRFHRDVLAAVAYLKERDMRLPVAVLGVGFGAGMALCAPAADTEGLISAVVADSPFTTLCEYAVNNETASFILRNLQRINPELEKRLRPEHAMAQPHHAAVLIMQSEGDEFSPGYMGKRLVDAYLHAHPNTPELLDYQAYTACPHLGLARHHTAGYAQRVLQFLAQHLQ
jgi:alpha-beta hydrolase superfamily lysophospholipase